MDLRQTESAAAHRSPEGAIFLPERQSPAYANAIKAATNAQETAANMLRIAEDYAALAKAWQVRADGHQATADHIATRTLGAGTLNVIE